MEFKDLKVIEKGHLKICRSSDYNFIFNKKTGFFARWGKTKKDDPQYGPSPEILDLEISSGSDCKGKCPFCYKGNGVGEETHNMTLDEFKTIFHKLPKTLTQIAYGILNISTNSDFFPMMEYARNNGVIPNYTCHGLDVTPEIAKRTSELCGAVAVSIINKEKTYDAIKMFSIDNNMSQVNMHYVLADQTYERAFEIVDDISVDPRLKQMNAIVFLQYKHKNENSPYHSVLDVEKYKKLTEYCQEKNVRYGMDSCSAGIFIESMKNNPDKKMMELFVEPCESGLMSSYISCKGKFFVCSFAEGEDEWVEGLDVLHCNDFIEDIWNHPRLIKWRERLIRNERNCPIYDLSFAGK